MRDRTKGTVLCLTAGVLWSMGGLLVRGVEAATPWQINFYRSAFMAASVFVYLGVRYRGGTLAACRAIGRTGLAAALFVGLSNMCFIVSLAGLTVANALFTFTIKPLLAALLGWVLLRERIERVTWWAMAVAALGIGIMVGDDVVVFDRGATGRLVLTGVAIAGAVCFSFYAALFRMGRGADMMPALGLAGVVVVAISAAVAGFDLAVSLHDLALTAIFGIVQAAIGLFAFIAGARYLPAAQIALLTLVEIVLGPIWVFLAFAEVPSWATLAGGALILGAVVWQVLGAKPAGTEAKPA